MNLPQSYEIRWRLLNALHKFLLIIEKDTADEKIAPLGKEIRDTANRWAPKAIALAAEKTSAESAINLALEKAINFIDSLPYTERRELTQECQLAYMALHNKYIFVAGAGVKLWPRELGDPPDLSDKQIIKALNCLRAKKDLILL